jgi:hypothetical protein
MFGATAAVFSFDRASRSLWFWPKGKAFDSTFNVLGCTLGLSGVTEGAITMENKPGHIDCWLERLKKVEAANRISLHEVQLIHGLLRYACGFLQDAICFKFVQKAWPLALASR